MNLNDLHSNFKHNYDSVSSSSRSHPAANRAGTIIRITLFHKIKNMRTKRWLFLRYEDRGNNRVR